jgi:DNA-binding transcriptional MerR regulator
VGTAAIPNRPVFRAQEVCDIADVQPYVLRSWEAEFPDIGVVKSEGGPRVYRKTDVEKVLRLKHLLFVDGLTLAGARKQLAQEGPAPVADDSVMEVEVLTMRAKKGLREIRDGLQYILTVLSEDGSPSEDFVLQPSGKNTKPAKKAKGKK